MFCEFKGLEEINETPHEWRLSAIVTYKANDKRARFYRPVSMNANNPIIKDIKPKYLKGDNVFVKESYAWTADGNKYLYKADYLKGIFRNEPNWHNSITMPESAARYHFIVTDVQPVKVEDITEEECLKMGIKGLSNHGKYGKGYLLYDKKFGWTTKKKESYLSLLQSLYGKNSGWVWKYKIEKV